MYKKIEIFSIYKFLCNNKLPSKHPDNMTFQIRSYYRTDYVATINAALHRCSIDRNIWKISFTARDGVKYRLIKNDFNPTCWTQDPLDQSYAPYREWPESELRTTFFIHMQDC